MSECKKHHINTRFTIRDLIKSRIARSRIVGVDCTSPTQWYTELHVRPVCQDGDKWVDFTVVLIRDDSRALAVRTRTTLVLKTPSVALEMDSEFGISSLSRMSAAKSDFGMSSSVRMPVFKPDCKMSSSDRMSVVKSDCDMSSAGMPGFNPDFKISPSNSMTNLKFDFGMSSSSGMPDLSMYQFSMSSSDEMPAFKSDLKRSSIVGISAMETDIAVSPSDGMSAFRSDCGTSVFRSDLGMSSSDGMTAFRSNCGTSAFRSDFEMTFPAESHSGMCSKMTCRVPSLVLPVEGAVVAEVTAELWGCCHPETFLEDFRKAASQTPKALTHFRHLQHDLRCSLEQELLADFEFRLESTNIVVARVSKLLLSIWSPHMRRRLESTNDRTWVLTPKLAGRSGEAVRRLMRCLYFADDDPIPTGDDLHLTFKLACFLGLPLIQQLLRKRIMDSVNHNNVVEILAMALKRRDKELKEFCVRAMPRLLGDFSNDRRLRKLLSKHPELEDDFGISDRLC